MITLSDLKQKKDAFIKFLLKPYNDNIPMALVDFFDERSISSVEKLFSDKKIVEWFKENILRPIKKNLVVTKEPSKYTGFVENLSNFYIKGYNPSIKSKKRFDWKGCSYRRVNSGYYKGFEIEINRADDRNGNYCYGYWITRSSDDINNIYDLDWESSSEAYKHAKAWIDDYMEYYEYDSSYDSEDD